MERENELLERLRQKEARLERKVIIMSRGYVFSILFFFAAGVFLFFAPPKQLLNSLFMWVFPVATTLFMVVITTIVLLSIGSKTEFEKEKQRTNDLVARLRELRQQHPELLLLNEVSETLKSMRARAESQRSFWSSFWFGMFFMVLGFALSYMTAKLGWLP